MPRKSATKLPIVKSTQATTKRVSTPRVSVLRYAAFFSLFNLIPHSPDGLYKARLARRLAQLLAQAAYVRHDRIVVV